MCAAALGLAGIGLADELPISNDAALRGITGYSVVVVAHPRLAREAGIDTQTLQSAVEASLREARLLSDERRSSGSAGIYIGVSLTPPRGGLQAWYIVLQVQELIHLARTPRTVNAVTWSRAAYGLSSQAGVKERVQSAIEELTAGLVVAHSEGNPPVQK